MLHKKIYNLTNQQKSILITEQFYKGSSINNICGTATINQKVNFKLLKKAIQLIMERNDIFKINLSLQDNNVVQKITPSYNTKIAIITLSTHEELKKYEQIIASRPFELFDSFLYNFYIFKFPNGHGAFTLNIHHIISDSWTLGLISREIIEEYNRLQENNAIIEDSPTYSYLEYIESEKEYLESNRYQKDKEYWENKFITIPSVASLSTKKNIKKNNSTVACRKLFEFDKKLMENIRSYCHHNSVSLYNFFMAIYAIYISEITNLDRFVIGTPILNRTNKKEKNTAGMFISTRCVYYRFRKYL